MLPQSYELPAAILLVIAGALACFAGYRLFRSVLAIFGFILGAMLASSMMGISNTAGMIVAAIVCGLIGAAVLVLASFVGIALLGAALGALVVAPVVWRQVQPADPPELLIIVLAILGAIGAMLLQRYVGIVGTAFVGAWAIILGALAGDGASTSNVWILYPLTPAPGRQWIPIAWIALGLMGTAVQLGVTARKR